MNYKLKHYLGTHLMEVTQYKKMIDMDAKRTMDDTLYLSLKKTLTDYEEQEIDFEQTQAQMHMYMSRNKQDKAVYNTLRAAVFSLINDLPEFGDRNMSELKLTYGDSDSSNSPLAAAQSSTTPSTSSLASDSH